MVWNPRLWNGPDMGYRGIEGIILRRRDIFENDQEITLLTAGEGGLKLQAKHGRSSQKIYCGRLEPPNLVRLTYYQSREQSAKIISRLRIVEPFAELFDRSSIRRFIWPLLSLYADLFPEGKGPEDCYQRFITGLKLLGGGAPPVLVATRILVRTAVETGISPDFQGCCNCGETAAGSWVLSPDRGLYCPVCRPAVKPEEFTLPADLRRAYMVLEKVRWNRINSFILTEETLVNLESLLYRFFHYHFDISMLAFQLRNSL